MIHASTALDLNVRPKNCQFSKGAKELMVRKTHEGNFCNSQIFFKYLKVPSKLPHLAELMEKEKAISCNVFAPNTFEIDGCAVIINV